jgi:hypothetical protein
VAVNTIKIPNHDGDDDDSHAYAEETALKRGMTARTESADRHSRGGFNENLVPEHASRGPSKWRALDVPDFYLTSLQRRPKQQSRM